MSSKKTSKRPAKLPADARWNEETAQWEVGTKRGKDSIGTWRYFRASGELAELEEWGDRSQLMTYQRFHPNGEVAQSGSFDPKTNKHDGVLRWMRLDVESPEDKSFPGDAASLRLAEYTVEQGYITRERYFDKKGKELCGAGTALPKRPSTVSPDAYFAAGFWVQQRRNILNDKPIGEWVQWNAKGELLQRRRYKPEGVLVESTYTSTEKPPSPAQIRAEANREKARAKQEAKRAAVVAARPALDAMLDGATKLDVPELEKITSIKWVKLFQDHEATFAKRFPDYLKALTSPDPVVVDYAAELVRDRLEVQGAISEATPLAIPFLIRLLCGKRSPASFGAIAFILAMISGASAFPEVNDEIFRAARAGFRKHAADLKRVAKGAPKAHRKWMKELLDDLREM